VGSLFSRILLTGDTEAIEEEYMSACLDSSPLTVIRGPDEAITRCVHSASRRSWCPWFPYYVSTHISGCPPPFVHSMNVSANSPLIVGREGVPAHVLDIHRDVSGD
jgi:hypothetical protein